MKKQYQTISSTFGKNLKVTIFGGSHEEYIGVSIENFPKNIEINFQEMEKFLKRRSPGTCHLTSPRKEPDTPICLQGITDNRTNGDTIIFHINNLDFRSKDYEKFKNIPRPSHCDYTASIKYGDSVNLAGSGPFSGRMTAPLCIAGFFAKTYLESQGIFTGAHISSVGRIQDDMYDKANLSVSIFEEISKNIVSREEAGALPVINSYIGQQMMDRIKQTANQGDSVGGTVECAVLGLKAGLGAPMYDGLESHLSQVLFGIPGVKGIEFGSGFQGSETQGSINNDPFIIENNKIKTTSNNHGGILGGISSGMPLIIKVAFKPTSSIAIPQKSINLNTFENTILEAKGRHDPCIAIRAVPAVESAVALVLLDVIIGDNKNTSVKKQKPIYSIKQFTRDNLLNLRKEIDIIDDEILKLFIERMNKSKEIGKFKKSNNISITNKTREDEILHKVSKNLPEDLKKQGEELFQKLFSLSKSYQNQ